MKFLLIVSAVGLVAVQAFPSDESYRVRRGAAAPPGGGYGTGPIAETNYVYGASAAGAYGTIDYGAAAATSAAELANSKSIASGAASQAIAAAVGANYDAQLATTAQFVAAYTRPNSYQSLNAAYNAVNQQQESAQIASALTAAGSSIWNAASQSASTNFASALQAAQGGAIASNAAQAYSTNAVIGAGAAYAANAAAQQQAAAALGASKATNAAIGGAAILAVNGITGTEIANGSGYGYGH